MRGRANVAVIIPALNEGPRVGGVIEGVRRESPHADIVVIDDGSVDDTAEIAHLAGARVLSNDKNIGYGLTVQRGYRNRFVPGHCSGADNGYRMPLERLVGRRFFRALLVLLTGRHFSDPTSGFQVIRGSAVSHLTATSYPRRHPDAAAIYYVCKAGLRVREEPAVFHPSPPGKPTLHRGLRPIPYVAWQLADLLRISIERAPVARRCELEIE